MATDKTRVEYGYDPLGRLAAVAEVRRNGAELGANKLVTAYAFTAAGNVGTVG